MFGKTGKVLLPPEDSSTFFSTDLVTSTNLVRAVNVRILASLAPPLCFTIE